MLITGTQRSVDCYAIGASTHYSD